MFFLERLSKWSTRQEEVHGRLQGVLSAGQSRKILQSRVQSLRHGRQRPHRL